MKLKKILKLSAFTLLCTSSIMAAVGDNMNAGLGVTGGTSLQEQTWMDNYADSDTASLTEGPIGGVDFGANFIVSDAASSTSIVDFRNVYYPKIKTNVAGLAFNYKMKNDGGLGHGFYAAVDYTRYDDFNFFQAALGHETRISGFGSNLNVYIPFGNTETYDWASGSEIIGTYGVDWTLSKKIESLGFGATASYHFHDDIKDNMTAFSLGSEYTFNKNMLTAGAGYQYRDGLDSEKHGYKVYARVPLYKGFAASGMGMYGEKGLNMYKPMKRMLGGVLQAKKADCGAGLESYAYAGVTSCVAGNPFDAANLRSGSLLDAPNKGDMTVGPNNITIIPRSIILNKLTAEPGSIILIADGAVVAMGEGSAIGSATTGDEYATIGALTDVQGQASSGTSRGARAVSSHLGSFKRNGVNTPDSTQKPAIVFRGNSHVYYLADGDSSTTTTTTISPTTGDFEDTIIGSVFSGGTIANSSSTFDNSEAAGQGNATITMPSGELSAAGSIGGGTTVEGTANTQHSVNQAYISGADIVAVGAQTRVSKSVISGGRMEFLGGSQTFTSNFITPDTDSDYAVMNIGGTSHRHVGNYINASDNTSSQFKVIDFKGGNQNSTPDDARSAANAKGMAATSLTGNYTKYSKYGGSQFGLKNLNGSINGGTSIVALNNTSDYELLQPTNGSTLSEDDNTGLGNLPKTASSQFSSAGVNSDFTTYSQARGSVLTHGNSSHFSSSVSSSDSNKLVIAQNHGLGTSMAQPTISGARRVIEGTNADNATITLAQGGSLFADTAGDDAAVAWPGTNSNDTVVYPIVFEDKGTVTRGEVSEALTAGTTAPNKSLITAANQTAASQSTVADTADSGSSATLTGDASYSAAYGNSTPMNTAADTLDTADSTKVGSMRAQVSDSGYLAAMDTVDKPSFDADSATGKYSATDLTDAVFSVAKTAIGRTTHPTNKLQADKVTTTAIVSRDDAAVNDHAAYTAADGNGLTDYGSVDTDIVGSAKSRPTSVEEIASSVVADVVSKKGTNTSTTEETAKYNAKK